MGLRLRRLLCGEASPFRGVTSIPNQEASLAGKPEAFRTAERQSRVNARIFRQFGHDWVLAAATPRRLAWRLLSVARKAKQSDDSLAPRPQ